MRASGQRHPKDPRVVFANHREHGPRRFFYGWVQIAALLGCSEKRAQNMAALRMFDPASIESVIAFREQRRAKKGSR